MRLNQFFVILALCCLIPVTAQAQKPPLTVEKVRYGQNAGQTRIVLELNDKADYRVFTLSNPNRVLIDLPPSRMKIAKSAPSVVGVLKQYRSGALDDGTMRIVFDLRRPALVSNVALLPGGRNIKDRLVIDLTPAAQNLFTAREKEIFGNADIRGKSSAAKSIPALTQRLKSEEQMTVPMPVRKPQSVTLPGNTVKKKYTVVIDAGHGGQDPGAVAHGLREKNITLAVAQALRQQLEETGRYRVVMTRARDVYIKLHERVDLSRREEGDLFVSIHADMMERSNTRGASIYTLSSTASDAETARLADDANNSGVVAGVDLRTESEDVAGILLDLAMREKMNESSLLARFIEESFRRESIRLLPNSHRSAGFAVLKAPDIPAVLIETGFLSNPEEARLLSTPQFQRKIAEAISLGIDAYFRKIEALQKF